MLVAMVPVLAGVALSACGAPEACHGCTMSIRHDGGIDAPAVDHPLPDDDAGVGGGGGGGSGGGGAAGSSDDVAPDRPSNVDSGGGSGGGGASGMDAPVEAPRDVAPMETAPEVPVERPPDLPPNLIAFYAFDQASGTTVTDTSGKGRNAQLMGAGSFAAGQVRNDLSLTGTTGYVDLPDHMLDAATEMTVTFWVKVRTDKTWQRVFDFGNSTSVYMFFTPHASGSDVMRFAISMGGINGEQRLDGTTVLAAGTWRHVGVVLGAGGGTLYLDGASAATAPTMTLRPSALGALMNNWIGRSEYTADPFFDGEIDEFRLYDRALSAAEITTLFQQR